MDCTELSSAATSLRTVGELSGRSLSVLIRPGFSAYPVFCPAVAGRVDSWSA